MTRAQGKALSLIEFAKRRGAPLATFELALTVDEGLELLDEMAGLYYLHDGVFAADVSAAHLERDPWPVLSHFRLLGLTLTPVQALH